VYSHHSILAISQIARAEHNINSEPYQFAARLGWSKRMEIATVDIARYIAIVLAL
jgi:hypothetical protein